MKTKSSTHHQIVQTVPTLWSALKLLENYFVERLFEL